VFSADGEELEASAHDLGAARWSGDKVDHAALSGAHDVRKVVASWFRAAAELRSYGSRFERL
jgi:hypothetical protein